MPRSGTMIAAAAALLCALVAGVPGVAGHSAEEKGHVCPHAEHVAPQTRRELEEFKSMASVSDSFHGSRRIMQSDEPAPMRFHTDFEPSTSLSADLNTMLETDLMPRVTQALGRLINVKTPVDGTLKLPRKCQTTNADGTCGSVVGWAAFTPCFTASRKQEYYDDYTFCSTPGSCQTVTGGSGVEDADFVLYVTAVQDNVCSGGAIAVGGFCDLDASRGGRPVSGFINFCAGLIGTPGITSEFLFDTAVHEILHGLAFDKSLYDMFIQPEGWTGATYPYVMQEDPEGLSSVFKMISPTLVEVGKEHYGCNQIDGLEMENGGGAGTAGFHWETRLLNNDLMLPNSVISKRQVVSNFTLALLEDSGWYVPNWALAGAEIFGKGKGCSFLSSSCDATAGNVVDIALTPDFCPAGAEQATMRCQADRLAPGRCISDALVPGCQRAEAQVINDQLLTCNPGPGATSEFLELFGQSFGPDSRCLDMAPAEAVRKVTGTDQSSEPTEYTLESFLAGAGCFGVRCEGDTVYVRVSNVVKLPAGQFPGSPSMAEVECPPDGEIRLSELGIGLTSGAPQLPPKALSRPFSLREIRLSELGIGLTSGTVECPPASEVCPSLGCPNDCRGLGRCDAGTCRCFLGHYGADCGQADCAVAGCPSGGACNANTGACDGQEILVPSPPAGFETPVDDLPRSPPPPPREGGPLPDLEATVMTASAMLEGCPVYLDLNDNGAKDVGDPEVTTDSMGKATFVNPGEDWGTKAMRVLPSASCMDAISQLPLAYELSSFAKNKVVSPLTTAAVNLWEIRGDAETPAQAEAAIMSQLNLGGVALADVTPYAAGVARRRGLLQTQEETAVYDASVQAHNVVLAAIAYIRGVAAAATDAPSEAAILEIARKAGPKGIPSAISQSSSTLSLVNLGNVRQVIENAADFATVDGLNMGKASAFATKNSLMAAPVVDVNQRVSALGGSSLVHATEASRIAAYVQTTLSGAAVAYGRDAAALATAGDESTRAFQSATTESSISGGISGVSLPGSTFPSPPLAPPSPLITEFSDNPADDPDAVKSDNMTLIAAAVGGGVGSLIIFCMAYWFCCRKGSRDGNDGIFSDV